MPPERGNAAANWTDENELQSATNAAIQKETSKAGPASPAAGAIIANMPAPRIAASPVAIASNKLSCGLRDCVPKNHNQYPYVVTKKFIVCPAKTGLNNKVCRI